MSTFGFQFSLYNSKTGDRLISQSVRGDKLRPVLEHIARVIYGQKQALGEAEVIIRMHRAVLNDGRLVEDQERMETLGSLLTMMTEHYNHKAKELVVKSIGPTNNKLAENFKRILADPKKVAKLVTSLQELKLPDLETDDTLLVGKWKNRRAVVKGFDTDEHGQPIAKTNKGDQPIFKGRVAKLMPDNDPQKPKPEPVAEAERAALAKGKMQEGIVAQPREGINDGLPRHGYKKDNSWEHEGRMYRHPESGAKALVHGAGWGNDLKWTHWDKDNKEKSGQGLHRLSKHLDKIHKS